MKLLAVNFWEEYDSFVCSQSMQTFAYCFESGHFSLFDWQISLIARNCFN